MATNPVQLPPQALEAEMAVLGSMLIERDAVEKTVDILVEKDFYQDAHRKVYRALFDLYTRGAAVDLVTAGAELGKSKALEEVGGTPFLSELIHRVATAAHVEHYARLVKEKAILRELITTATGVVSACYLEAKEPSRILDEAQTSILRVADRQNVHGIVEAKELAHQALEQIEAAHKDKRTVTGVPSGLTKLDDQTSGFQKKDLILIAARPSQGKTALGMNIATHVAVIEKKPVLIFSLEMSHSAIMQRMISSEAGVDLRQIRTGYFRRDKWTDLTNAAARIAEAPLYFCDQPALSIMTLRTMARQKRAEIQRKGQQLGLIVIDYLQLMRGSSFAENRQQEVAEISRGLKALAKDLDVPVIALAQLSRRTEEKGRADARPQLSDLRESGSLEQDADLVCFIYREAYYKPNDPTLERKAQIIIAKQRQGPVGIVDVAFDRHLTRFSNETSQEGPTQPEDPVVFEEAQTTFSE